MDEQCNCEQCRANRAHADNHARDPVKLKDEWLGRSLTGACMSLCHVGHACVDSGAGNNSVQLVPVAMPISGRRVSLSAHILQALGMHRRAGPNKLAQHMDTTDAKVLRKLATDLRSRPSRKLLTSLGARRIQVRCCHGRHPR